MKDVKAIKNTAPAQDTNPYRIPEGYFGDLRNHIMARVAEEQSVQAKATGWQSVRWMAAFAAGFCGLALLATVGYYLTGHKARQREIDNNPLMGYTVTAEDLAELLYYEENAAEEQAQFAEAAAEYLETYGYGYGNLYAELVTNLH